MTRVLRYPFEAITSDTDYLQVTIKKYQPIGLGAAGTGPSFINENNSSTIGNNNPAQITVEDVMLLPMPSAINDRNQVKYGPDSLDNISSAVAGSTLEIMDKVGGNLATIGKKPGKDDEWIGSGPGGKRTIGDFLTDSAKDGSNILADKFQGLTGAAGGEALKQRILTSLAAEAASIIPGVNVTGTQLLSRENGTILNPNMTLLMNAPSLRSFNFQFKMTPRDDREAKQVKSIIRSFKKNMAPFTETSKTFLKTPNVFELRYKKGNDDHPFLHQFKQCALTDISTNYTGEGVYATYGDGSPISTIMTLQFTELVPIYQSDYGDDGDFDADSDGVGY
tara:strand:+ start:2384 stop:3391 length:1008 start_codon:yes stop_codon:yes gene_type:complete